MSQDVPPVLEVEGLHAAYGAVPALRGVDLLVLQGGAVAILGRNGAGKSTLLRALMGLVRLQGGSVRLLGQEIGALAPEARHRLGIGYCPEGRRLFPGLTIEENLLVACPEPAAVRTARLEQAYALFPDLAARRRARAWRLSGGQQQMAAVARALMGAPRLLLLDEPTAGLSPRLADAVMERIPAIRAGGCGVLLAGQDAGRALAVCDNAVVLRDGQVTVRAPAAPMLRDGRLRDALL